MLTILALAPAPDPQAAQARHRDHNPGLLRLARHSGQPSEPEKPWLSKFALVADVRTSWLCRPYRIAQCCVWEGGGLAALHLQKELSCSRIPMPMLRPAGPHLQ